nr:alpha-1,4 glucan phosphorylase L-2 isozyme, chloroplastic/amyloplastic [Tanacetum cinerariifolium]
MEGMEATMEQLLALIDDTYKYVDVVPKALEKWSLNLLQQLLPRQVGLIEMIDSEQMPEAVREAVQTQTDWLQDSIQRENDEFLKTIDENMKKIIKEHVKTQVKAQVTRILPRIEESMNAQLEAEEGPSAGSDWGSKRQRKGGEHASTSTLSEPATESVGRSTTGINLNSCLPVSAEDQPIIQTTQHPEWFSQPKRPPTPDRDWNKTLPAAQGNTQSWISALAK